MANSADPDQLASSEANWSGSTLFAKAEHIRVQQDKGYDNEKAYTRTSPTANSNKDAKQNKTKQKKDKNKQTCQLRPPP